MSSDVLLCGSPALASAASLLEGLQSSTFTHHSHYMREPSHQLAGGMVAGEIQRLPEGKSHLRRLCKTPPHPDRRVSPRSRKKLQVIICVLLVELFERFTFFGIVCNMILFCTVKLGYDNYLAATVNLCFIGASTLTPVLVGWFAETCLGRTKVLYLCAFLHFFGTAMLPVVAFPFEDFYIDMHHMSYKLEPHEQQALFYTGLLAAALGIGGIRAILCPMGAYSLQSYNQYQLLGFFNWFYWLVNLNSTVVFLGIAYIQQSVAKNLAFLIPFTSALLALIAIHMMRNKLTYKPKKGGSLLTTLGVFLNSLKMCCLHYRHLSGDVPSWLDRAKENNGGRYSETHVENVKVLAKLFPLYGLQLLYRACLTQIPSGYYIQTMNSNLHLNDVLLPIGTMNVISILPLLMLAPLMECVTTFSLSFAKTPPAPTRVVALGHACAALSVLVAGLSELHRKSFPLVEQTLSGKVLQVSSMPCFQLAPQYILLGLAEALVTPACSLISFQLTPGHIRGISLHFLTLSYGGGCFLGALCIQLLYLMSGGNFYPNVLHDGNLERFFFLMATLMLINTFIYWTVSHRYMDLSVQGKALPISPLTEKLLQYKARLRYYDSMEHSYTNNSYNLSHDAL
ncbi:solute carrier family 15 member 5 [Dunckerocampus dactyliophorus]|uniref:solute carrier family 15 member 5 n=1 Tax=Dunckerocampus dactyliophorus TaxID=161453 RepID=UPI0024072571|nr:solute carrier family 15 member 5 [Dunckerocampus dactyliophorus]